MQIRYGFSYILKNCFTTDISLGNALAYKRIPPLGCFIDR